MCQIVRAVRENRMRWLPGHFYSPIPALHSVLADEARIFAIPDRLPGIDLHLDEQLELVDQLSQYGPGQPFHPTKTPGLRYYFENPSFGYGDGIVMYSMLRHLRPKRLIEIGGGFSSALALDTNDRSLDRTMRCTFIEPYPDFLRGLLRPSDFDDHTLLPVPVQSVDVELFRELGPGDVLFVDSTHVAKVGSDVNHIFSEILPILRPGVVVHFHDVTYPFEYPKEWISGGISWNEAYLLRAFLMFNSDFRILLFNSHLGHLHRDRLLTALPLYRKHGGGSIWIQRTSSDGA